MENSERDELDRMMVLSKLGMPMYGEITTAKRTYQVVAVCGIPVELNVFASTIMRHCAGYGLSTAPALEASSKAFWEDVGFEAPTAQFNDIVGSIPNANVGVGRLIIDSLQGRALDMSYVTKYDKEFDFLPVLKNINEQIKQYVK